VASESRNEILGVVIEDDEIIGIPVGNIKNVRVDPRAMYSITVDLNDGDRFFCVAVLSRGGENPWFDFIVENGGRSVTNASQV